MTDAFKEHASWFAPPADLPDGTGSPVDECITRIEALKIRILRLPLPDEWEKTEILQELNTLRAACLFLATQAPEPQPEEKGPPVALGTPPPANLEIEGILGQNPIITRNLEKIARIAPTRMTMLLEGETGSGKELFARIIHLNSTRAKFVAVNCGAFPPGTIESELFGHTRGAFTGATGERKGTFEEANGGTIFLDEIGDLELQAQVKLLRVLDSGELQRVGSDKIVRVDVRVVAATNKNLQQMVRDGIFREDLFYRLSQCHLWIPPLRERRDEIEILFEFFVKRTCHQYDKPLPVLDKALHHFLFHVYDYPGNVRELKNIAEYIVHIFDGGPVVIEDLPERYGRAFGTLKAVTTEAEAANVRQTIKDVAERDFVAAVMARNGGDIRRCCDELGVSRSRLYQLLKKYGVKPADYRGERR